MFSIDLTAVMELVRVDKSINAGAAPWSGPSQAPLTYKRVPENPNSRVSRKSKVHCPPPLKFAVLIATGSAVVNTSSTTFRVNPGMV